MDTIFDRMAGEIPRYWKSDTQEVDILTKRLAGAPIPLRSLLGTYECVHVYYEDDPALHMSPNDPGQMTLMSSVSPNPSSPEDISGSFRGGGTGFKNGSFAMLSPFVSRSQQAAGTFVPNMWRFTLRVPSQPLAYYDYEDDVHSLSVSEPVDDNGNHFLSLNLNYDSNDYSGHFWLFKKMVKAGLTEDEKRRLGMGLSSAEVERRGRERR